MRLPRNRSLGKALLALLFASAPLFAAATASVPSDSAEAPRRIPPIGPVFREVRSTPYPGGALYLSRGIAGAFLGGQTRNMGEDQSLFQWQGEVAYFYTPWFSAGAGFLVTAGEPSDTAQKVHNRYFLHVRFHKAWNGLAIYAGPRIGLDNLNVLTGSSNTDSLVRVPIQNTNAGLGFDVGGGWKFSRWVGLTFGGAAEYSLVGEENSLFGNNLNIHLLPGLAFDILAFSDHLRELVPALYITLEYQSGFLLFERGQHRREEAGIGGISLAF